MPTEPRAALRRWLSSGEVIRLDELGGAGALVAAAHDQGLEGFLYPRLTSALDAPSGVRNALRAGYRRSFALGVRALAAARSVQEHLGAGGVRALPMKGAALAEAVYDSVAERPMGDVDLLVLDDWRRAVALMEGAGYRVIERADHAWAFASPDGPIAVELHHSVTSAPGLFPLEPEALWARSRAGDGQLARRPGAEDLLVQLALHCAFQHGLAVTLVQYLDFRRVFERTPPDAETLLEAARRAHAKGALALSLLVAEAIVGLRLPVALRDSLARALPRGLHSCLRTARRDPLALIVPADPPIARIRWALASGRRIELAVRTLMPSDEHAATAWPRRAVAAASRAGRLARTWGPATLESFVRLPRRRGAVRHSTRTPERA
jgi:hypothetical protein